MIMQILLLKRRVLDMFCVNKISMYFGFITNKYCKNIKTLANYQEYFMVDSYPKF